MEFTPPGDISSPLGPTHDSLTLERGFPLLYQQTEELFPYGTLTKARMDSRTQKIGVRVTHPHWLVVDALLAFGTTVILGCFLEYVWRNEK